MTRFTLTLATLLTLASTTTAQQGEAYLSQPLPQEWEKEEIFTQALPCDDLWWKNFDDTKLDSLITLATERNPSALAAIEKMKQARAVWRQAQSPLFPQVGLTAGWQREKSSGNTAQTAFRESTEGYFSGGATVSWQVDIFGSVQMRAKAQKKLFQATEEEYRAVMVALCANVATTYLSLVQNIAQLRVLQNNVASQEEIIKIVTARYNSGLASKLDVAQSKSVYYNTLAQIPAMRASIENNRNSLAVLLGTYPSEMPNWESEDGNLPSYIAPIAVGLPATLLRRRPDIRAAEKQVEAAAASLGASKRDWLPTFYLNGSIGFASEKLKELPHSRSLTWEIAPTMQWNIFTGGERLNATKEARAVLEENIQNFNKSVLAAIQEVESAMSNYSNSISQTVAIKEAVNQCSETLKLSLELYKQGLTQFQNVLDAQRTLLSYQDYLVQARGTALKSLVQLYEALGGGW